MAISLIIKGDKFTAARHAAARLVPLVFVRETKFGETIGRVSSYYEADCRAWFAERDTDAQGNRVPGALLCFTIE